MFSGFHYNMEGRQLDEFYKWNPAETNSLWYQEMSLDVGRERAGRLLS